ncbi:hypothetical protein VPH35_046268 [Triticum aestivum]
MTGPLGARGSRRETRRAPPPRPNCLPGSSSHHGHTRTRARRSPETSTAAAQPAFTDHCAAQLPPRHSAPEERARRRRRHGSRGGGRGVPRRRGARAGTSRPPGPAPRRRRGTRHPTEVPRCGVARRNPLRALAQRRGDRAGGNLLRNSCASASLALLCSAPAQSRQLFSHTISVGSAQIAQAADEDVASVRVVLMMAFGPASPAVPPPTDGHASTVRVTFVLEKKCAFGQRFLVVGDDPALGLWDPAKATALDWSEGHVWTARADLPANRLVEFKFLLQDPSGHVRWQHGGNRALQVTEASSALVVYEDWDDAGCQEVSEAALHLPIGAEGTDALLLADDGRTDVDDQATYEGFMHAEKARAAAEASLHADTMWLNGANRPQVKWIPPTLISLIYDHKTASS